MSPPRRVLLSSGELSGDYHGAWLLKTLKAQAAERGIVLETAAIGAHRLKSEADLLWEDCAQWGGIGIFESLRVAPRVALALARIRQRLADWDPDLVIGVDYRVLHLRLLGEAHARGCRTAWYFPPVQWGYASDAAKKALATLYEGKRRKLNRFDHVARVTDLVLLTYPFSEAEYHRAGANVHYLGHPLANTLELESRRTPADVRTSLNVAEGELLVGVFPGSRQQELRDIWPLQRAMLAQLAPRWPQVRWYISAAHPLYRPRLARDLAALPAEVRDRVLLVDGSDPDLIRASDLVLMKSGTMAQTALLLEVPMVTCYRVTAPPVIGPPVLAASRKLFLSQPYFAFPNLLAGAEAVPELIQERCTVPLLVEAVEMLLADPAAREAQRQRLHALRAQLYRPDALTRAASLCLDLLEQPRG